MSDAALLTIEGVDKTFGGGRTLLGAERPAVHAVQDVSLDVRPGETLGVVGESGCGKSTLARMIVGLDRPTGGRITFDGRDLAAEAGRDLRRLSRDVQYVFQDPVASLNPRKTIRTILEAPLKHLTDLDAAGRHKRLEELMDAVNLAPGFLDRYPHEFSGGQAQRIGIARALAADPKLIVLDEPVSALDVSIQAQILNLLKDLQSEFKLTYLLISHDLSVVSFMSDAIGVMYLGRFMEIGPKDEVLRRSSHPYTMILKSAASTDEGAALPISGEIPSPLSPPSGCPFHTRCPFSQQICATTQPELEAGPAGQFSACHFAKDIRAGKPAGTCATFATGAVGR
ncbi:MAG: ATP-binding cassette domain-containing protein [Roseitalea porphyridii]